MESSMTRKQAILALLGVPAGFALPAPQISAGCTRPVEGIDGTIIGMDRSACPSRKVSNMLRIELVDPQYSKDPTRAGGIDGIEIDYHGHTITITAREIWEALGGR